MNTLDTWLKHCTTCAQAPASFYAGARKIIRPHSFSFPSLDKSINISHAGFTSAKIKALTKHYLHEESRDVAVQLWEKRRGQRNYGSVCFTTFNHFKKGDITGATPRGSVFGPCLQSVVLTHISRKEYAIDVFYRSTELFKKYAPDVVFIRDVLLPPFDTTGMTCEGVRFNFANLTAHSMYACTLFPLMSDPIQELERIKKRDPYFYKWVVKWSARYLVPKYEHGIQKFAQALRVQKDVTERLDPKMRRTLQRYLTDNHPGYSRTRFDHDEETD
jgi:hypothetical protein